MKDKRIVLGSLFGDEGKGNTVQFLCKEELAKGITPLVVRFSGGSQCGHRVVHEQMEHICSLLGSGVLLGCPTYLGKYVMIDPISLKNEWIILNSKYGLRPQVYIHPNCRVIIPDDIYNNMRNKETLRHGSCGCGIYECFKRYEEHSIQNSLWKAAEYPNRFLPDIVKTKNNEEFVDACKWLKEHCTIKGLNSISGNFDSIIFEGNQGLLLDMDRGFMPHCTPTRTGLNGVPNQYLNNAEVYLVMRSYLTRHGNGYEPKSGDVIRDIYRNLEEPTNPDDSVQGKFKIGVFEIQLLRDAFMRHCLDNYQKLHNTKFNIVVTHMDCTNDDHILAIDGDSPIMDISVIDALLIKLKRHYLKFDNIYLSYSSDSTNFKKISLC